MKRKQFTFYRAFFEAIEKLPLMKEKVRAYDLLCAYALDGTEPGPEIENCSGTKLFRLLRPNLDAGRKRSAGAVAARELLLRSGLEPEPMEDPEKGSIVSETVQHRKQRTENRIQTTDHNQ